jgi:TonB-linked SusC/RagA family outer membrane protein
MQKITKRKKAFLPPALSKIILIMKITCALLLFTLLHVSAAVFSQEKQINLNLRNVTIANALKQIELKTSYKFIYSPDIFPATNMVSGNFMDTKVSDVLDYLLKKTGFSYKLLNNDVIILTQGKAKNQLIQITGKVIDEKGNAMPGVTVLVKGSKQATITNSDGSYQIVTDPGNTLSFYFIGYKRKEIEIKGQLVINVQMEIDLNKLDEVLVVGYGTTTIRFNTGSISTITADDIDKQPVANVLQALQGEIPGLSVQQNTGYATGQFTIDIRGRKDIYNSNNPPLIILDGVPLPTSTGDLTNSGLNQNFFPGNNLGQNAFYGINPSDIATFEVLKDADATAIYGSRGANGVILITTKKGKPGKGTLTANYYTGVTEAPERVQLLNTQQYLEMRNEAFKNDGITPDQYNAPDLTQYSQTSYTDWQKQLTAAAITDDAQLAYSGGSENTTFRLSGGYHRDNTPVPQEFKYIGFSDQRLSFQSSINHSSADKKFTLNMVASYSGSFTNNPSLDYYDYNLPPNAPSILNSTGGLNYAQWGNYNLPYQFQSFFEKYKTNTGNLLGSLNLSYQIAKGLNISSSFGYTNTQMTQLATYPSSVYAQPQYYASQAEYGTNNITSYIIEPKADYTKVWGKGTMQATIGGTLTQSLTNGTNITGSGYANDNLVEDLGAAQSTYNSSNYALYRFQGYFARLNYNWDGKYILNLTGRRDGSSRFQNGDQIGTFGSAGAAWIFSEEKLLKDELPFLSFGKLRGSYGTTGSASAGDYKYLELYQASSATSTGYDGSGTLNLNQAYNPGFKWQVNKKLEAGLELGFLKDRISMTAVFYRERSGNQLVDYNYPSYLGVYPIVANIPAVVQNQGWEFTLNTVNIKSASFSWTTAFNVSFNRNKLLSYPGIQYSSYADQYVVGQSLSIEKLYHYTGVSPQTGLYTFEDVNHDGVYNEADQFNVNLDPKYQGGVINNFNYKGWQLSFLIDFKDQKGPYSISNGVAGGELNQPVAVLARWQKPGDITDVHKFTTFTGTDVELYNLSDAEIVNASYARLQNLSLSYSFKGNAIKRAGINNLKVFIQGQNLLIISPYKGVNPINPSLYNTGFPPQRIFTGGIQLTL